MESNPSYGDETHVQYHWATSTLLEEQKRENVEIFTTSSQKIIWLKFLPVLKTYNQDVQRIVTVHGEDRKVFHGFQGYKFYFGLTAYNVQL